MTLKYYNRKRDIFWARATLLYRNKFLLVLSLLMIGFAVYITCTGEEFHKAQLVVQILVAITAIGFWFAAYLGFMLGTQLIMVLLSKHTGLLGAHTLEIKEDGLEESTSFNQSLHRWNPSFKVAEHRSYICIYPTDGQYFIIPKRPGGHEGNLAEFVSQLKSRLGR